MRDRLQRQTSIRSEQTRLRRHAREILFAIALAGAGVFLAYVAQPLSAQEVDPEGEGPRWNSEGCLSCHDGSTDTVVFPSGEELSIAVDGAAYTATEHASIGVECAHCHVNIVRIPHDPVAAQDAASFSTSLATSCSQCHWRQERISLDQTHASLDPELRADAPGCVECHDPHAAEALALSSPEMQSRCGDCHAGPVWDEFETIHALDPTVAVEADPPPLILFYGLIAAAIAVIVLAAWGGVAAYQWLRNRQVSVA